ncbi:unnamed protein product [Rotaria sordida]|uniref:Beta-lactamase-related domain-containing protein n=1 Tax=Rotaria sordida TaxID=392033 RepID=A0A815K0T5_9BILA|nr:unnamed protein product [Rotaria sordida]
MIDLLEQERPVWLPGHAQGYHAFTYGWLAGELIRRVDPQRRTIGEFIREEIADRLQTEFYIGLPQEFEQRVSPLIFTDIERIMNRSMLALYEFFNEARAHQAEIPAGNGITNARSLARIFASLIGNIDDREDSRLLQPEILQRATTLNTLPNEIDIIMKIPFPFGMGFMLYEQDFPMFGSKSFGHTGAGGSIAFAAPAKNLSFAYVMNRVNFEAVTINNTRIGIILSRIGTMLDDNHLN